MPATALEKMSPAVKAYKALQRAPVTFKPWSTNGPRKLQPHETICRVARHDGSCCGEKLRNTEALLEHLKNVHKIRGAKMKPMPRSQAGLISVRNYYTALMRGEEYEGKKSFPNRKRVARKKSIESLMPGDPIDGDPEADFLPTLSRENHVDREQDPVDDRQHEGVSRVGENQQAAAVPREHERIAPHYDMRRTTALLRQTHSNDEDDSTALTVPTTSINNQELQAQSNPGPALGIRNRFAPWTTHNTVPKSNMVPMTDAPSMPTAPMRLPAGPPTPFSGTSAETLHHTSNDRQSHDGLHQSSVREAQAPRYMAQDFLGSRAEFPRAATSGQLPALFSSLSQSPGSHAYGQTARQSFRSAQPSLSPTETRLSPATPEVQMAGQVQTPSQQTRPASPGFVPKIESDEDDDEMIYLRSRALRTEEDVRLDLAANKVRAEEIESRQELAALQKRHPGC